MKGGERKEGKKKIFSGSKRRCCQEVFLREETTLKIAERRWERPSY